MKVRRDDQKSNALLAHAGFEGCWALVVQNLGGWEDTALGQIGVKSRLCADEFVLAL